MSQKKEKYARGVERGLSGLEERLGCVQAGQEEQSELIRRVLRERTAAEDTASRRISRMRRRAAEAERREELWRCIALAAMLALLVICLAVVLWEPEGTDAGAAEEARTASLDGEGPAARTIRAEIGLIPGETGSPSGESGADRGHLIRNCAVSYYCCERYPHICGTGDGITAAGTEARPWITCAVDPTVIPIGSTVTVDFGNGETVECIAEDVGAWVKGEHVDICVSGHQEALELGIRRAEVRWTEEGESEHDGQAQSHDRGGDPGV